MNHLAVTKFCCGLIAIAMVFAGHEVVQSQEKEKYTDFQFTSGELTLSGRLFVPIGDGPFPCVVITHGSEPGRRSGYRMAVEPFLKRGFAVVTYDKRGCGDSEGKYVEAPDLQIPAADLVACVNHIAKHSKVNTDKIGVFGVSQGGWVGPLAASKSELIRFVIMVSGPSISPLEQNLYDKGNQLAGKGLSKDEIREVTELRRKVWTYLAYDQGKEEAAEAWNDAKSKTWFALLRNEPPMGDRERLLKHPRLVHFAVHSKYDPKPVLKSLNVPVLSVYGDADTIVPAERCAKLMKEYFSGERAKLLTIKRFAKADHGIRVNANGTRRFADGYWESVLDWTENTVGQLKTRKTVSDK